MFSNLLSLGSVGLFLFLLEWAIRFAALFFVPRNRKPTAGMAWLLLIFFLPILGLLIYLFIGNPKLPKKRQNAQKTLDKFIESAVSEYKSNVTKTESVLSNVSGIYHPVAKLSESLSNLPAFSGNTITVLPEYNNVFTKIIKDIDDAKTYIHLEYFIFVLDDVTEPLFAAMARAVERGVTVRVLYDSLSTKRYPKWKEMLKRLDTDGVEAVATLPVRFPGKGYVRPDLRNHRKLVVIDGNIGYTGSQNLVKRTYHRKDDIYYDEMVVRIEGPVVLQLAAVFMSDWYSETGVLLPRTNASTNPSLIKPKGTVTAQVLPSGPGYNDENNLKLFTSLIHLAKKQLVIVNPYFVPDDALTNAITSAAKRGVEVIMINSEAMDQWMVGHAQRSFYESLLEAGVNIYLYKAPILLHSKFMIVDDEIATVGSSNLDIRSFVLDLEVTLIAYDAGVAKKLHKTANEYLAKSQQIKLSQWRKRSKTAQFMDSVARLTSSLQ